MGARRSGQGGFTLIEILIAMVVLGFGILAVASMQTSAARGTALGRRLTEANNLASQQIELFKTLPYADASIASGSHMPDDTVPGGTPDDDTQDGALGYTISWTVTDDDPLTDMKKIDVTVVSNDAKHPRTVKMTSYKADL
jgi:prepilin-type N-terminal cleavage/methylation domain-containing protein